MRKFMLLGLLATLLLGSCGGVKSKKEFKTARQFLDYFLEKNEAALTEMMDTVSISAGDLEYCFTTADIKGYTGTVYEPVSYSSGIYTGNGSRFYAFMFAWKGELHQNPKHRIEIVVLDSAPDKVLAFRLLEGKNTLAQFPEHLSGMGKPDKVVKF